MINNTPLEKANRTGRETTSTRNKCAQLAADKDNYRSTIDRVVSDTSIAINTPEVVEILKDLYPEKHTLHDIYNDITPRNFVTAYKPLALERFIKLFAEIPQGKAVGPLGDITYIIKSMALYIEHPNKKHIYADTIFKLFIKLNTDQIPNSIKNIIMQSSYSDYTKMH